MDLSKRWLPLRTVESSHNQEKLSALEKAKRKKDTPVKNTQKYLNVGLFEVLLYCIL